MKRRPTLVLTTLGQASLAVRKQGKTRQPIFGPGKPVELIAYLTCAPARTATRERLVDLLWADRTPDAGHHDLRQTLWHVRRRLGRQVVSVRHGNVELAADVNCDRDAFIAAVDVGDVERAVTLYGGEFLPVLIGSGAAGFEAWAELERYRLRRLFCRAAETLVRRWLAAARYSEAWRLARRVRDADPHEEGAWVLLLEALLSAGDPARAAAEADLFERVIATDGRIAQPQTIALLRRVRRGADQGSPNRRVDRLTTPLTGRDHEFGVLLRAWETARREAGRHLHIEGGVGIGKTRLLHEIQARLRAAGEQVLYLSARFPARRVVWGFASELAAALAPLPGSAGVSSGAAASLVALNPSLSFRYAAAPDPARDEDAMRRRALALLELVKSISEEAPLALLCDDVHWGDSASTEALAWVFAQLSGTRVLRVTAGTSSWAEVVATGSMDRLELKPLTLAEVRTLVSSLAPLPLVEWGHRIPEWLHQGSSGSPRIVLERLETALERGQLRLEGASWSCPDPSALAAEFAAPALTAPLPMLVSPFQADGSAGMEHWVDGMTEGLINELSRIETLRVIAFPSALRLKDINDLHSRAGAVGAQYVLEGKVAVHGDRLDVAIHLRNAQTGSLICQEVYSGSRTDVFTLREQIVKAVVAALHLPLSTSEARKLGDRPPIDIDTYDCYLRARQALLRFRPDEFERALQILAYGMQRGGRNGLLYATLGQAYWTLVFSGADPVDSLLTRAKECGDTVLKLEPDAPYGHVLVGSIAWTRGRVQDAVTHYRRALALDPNNPDALLWLGSIYAAAGKGFAARALADRLLEIDPLTAVNHSLAGCVALFEGRFEEALPPYRQAFELDPCPPAHLVYALALARVNHTGRACELLEALERHVAGASLGQLGGFLARTLAGSRHEALKQVTPQVEALGRYSSYVAWHLGVGHSLIGEFDSAFAWLRHAADLGFVSFPFLLSDPMLAQMRGHSKWLSLADEFRRRWEGFEV